MHAAPGVAAWPSLDPLPGAAVPQRLRTPEAPPVRPLPTSPEPEVDMQTVMHYLKACVAEEAVAARFRLEEGDCALVDNLRVAHGREPYQELERAMWQVWVWTNTSIAVPASAGPNREWMRHPKSSTAGAAAKEEL